MTFLSLLSQLVPAPSSLWPASGADLFRLCQFAFLTSPLMVPIFRVVQAPFGRFSIPSPFNLPGNLAWFLMEIPSPITFALALASAPLTEAGSSFTLRDVLSPSLSRLAQLPKANLLLAGLFLTHYFQRAVISPIRAPPRSPLHLLVASLAVIFNLINGFMLGSWVGGRSPQIHLPSSAFASTSSLGDTAGEKLQSLFSGAVPGRTIASPGLLPNAFSTVITNPVFLLAIAGWAVGFASNVYHDEILSDLRRPKEKRVTKAMVEEAEERGQGAKEKGPKYGIPRGGLYKWVSYPNYLSECESSRRTPCFLFLTAC